MRLKIKCNSPIFFAREPQQETTFATANPNLECTHTATFNGFLRLKQLLIARSWKYKQQEGLPLLVSKLWTIQTMKWDQNFSVWMFYLMCIIAKVKELVKTRNKNCIFSCQKRLPTIFQNSRCKTLFWPPSGCSNYISDCTTETSCWWNHCWISRCLHFRRPSWNTSKKRNGDDPSIPLQPSVQPNFKSPFKPSQPEQMGITKQSKLYLGKGWLKPSRSPWGAPVFLVKKPHSTTLNLENWCDSRALNANTLRESFARLNPEQL